MTGPDTDGMPPPHDHAAEAAVLSAVLLDASALAKVAWLTRADFYSEAHGRIFEACQQVSATRAPVDLVTVRERLHECGRLAQVGGAGYLSEVADGAPFVANVAAYAAIVRRKADDRAALADLERASAEIRIGTLAAEGAIRRVAIGAEVRARRVGGPDTRADSLSVTDLFAPLPAIPFVAKMLDLCPGAPAMIAGYGYSGKTVSAQSLLLSVAVGRAAWACPKLSTSAGRVVHFDYEQGRRLTSERYQRLALAMEIDRRDLEGRLSACIYPRIYLDDDDAEDFYVRHVEGATLALVDSFRAGLREGDENDSRVRRHLDMLARVSERTGCTMLVIHHARKPSRNDAGGARSAIRGSGAIFDACSSVLVFEGAERGGPITVTHEKARTTGRPIESFALVVEDAVVGADPHAGLRVSYRAIEAAAEERKRKRASENASLDTTIVAHVRENGPTSASGIARMLSARKGTVLEAVRDLVDRGALERTADDRLSVPGGLSPSRPSRFQVPPPKGGGNRDRFPGTVGNRQEPVPYMPESLPFPVDRRGEPAEAEE